MEGESFLVDRQYSQPIGDVVAKVIKVFSVFGYSSIFLMLDQIITADPFIGVSNLKAVLADIILRLKMVFKAPTIEEEQIMIVYVEND